MMRRKALLIAIALAVQFLSTVQVAQSGPEIGKNLPVPDIVSAKLQRIFQKYYPNATYFCHPRPALCG